MSRTGKYRSLDLEKRSSGVLADPFFRIISYLIDAILIRFAFQSVVFVLGARGLISESWMESIGWYLGQGLAPYRGGGVMLDHFLFINTFEDLVIHLSYSAIFMVYFILLESKKFSGQTLGKKIFGMKVADKRGSGISLKDSVTRNSTKYLLRVPILNYIVGLTELILLIFYGTRTGDMLADTKVISIPKKGLLNILK